MAFPRIFWILCLAVLVAGCGREEKKKTPVLRPIAYAFAGPMNLPVREEISPRSKTVATLRHGEKVTIVDRRRRWMKVQMPDGAVGWLDSRDLLTERQVDELRSVAARHAKAPTFGQATVFQALNIHTEPNRGAPSFHQIPAKGLVDVLGHRLVERQPYKPTDSIIPAPPPRKPAAKKKPKETESRVPPPPAPQPPAPPANWLDLSRTAELPEAADPQQKKQPQKVDDWTLVRTAEGKIGWALTGMLSMAIPDEVAQYSEGARITSYFSLGTVPSGDKEKHHWLWTTNSQKFTPFDFDSFRIFIFNARKSRYETAYIERRVTGYFPVEVNSADDGPPLFSLVVEDKNGQKIKKTFRFEGYRVTMVSKEPWSPSPAVETGDKDEDHDESPAEPRAGGSWLDRIRRVFR
jgi:hypothetical protein